MNIINRKIRNQRSRNLSFINDLKTTEFSEKFGFSVDYGKNYNSDEHKIEKFGTSDLENLEIIIFLKNMKKSEFSLKFRFIHGFWKKL